MSLVERYLVLELNSLAGIEALAAGFKDGGGVSGRLDGGEVFTATEDEVGDTLISVTCLSGEAAIGIRGVTEEEGVG